MSEIQLRFYFRMANVVRNYLQFVLAPFTGGHARFVGSSALTLIFPLISMPILARLYTPEDFGVYAVFYALATICSVVSTLELRNITFIEPTRELGAHGTLLTLIVVLMASLALFTSIIVTSQSFLSRAFGDELLPYMIWLPFTVFLMGVGLALNAWATRENKFRELAQNNLILGFSTLVFQLGLGMFSIGPLGLIIANMLGLTLSAALLSLLFFRSIRNLHLNFSCRSAMAQLRKHQRLVLWMMPGTLLNSTSQLLPELLISRLFGASSLGQYSLAMRVVNTSVGFLSNSLQRFFQQQASEEFRAKGHCTHSFWRFALLGLLVVMVVILPIVAAMPYLFPIVFGPQWTESGDLLQAVAILIILRFISSPLSYVWVIRGQLRLNFIWQLGLIFFGLVTLTLPSLMGFDVTLYYNLWIYSVGVGGWYLFAILISYILAKRVRLKFFGGGD